MKLGVWQRLLAVLVEEYDEVRGQDWSYLSVDGTMTEAAGGSES